MKMPTLAFVAALFVGSSIVHADAFTPAFMANVQAEGQSQFMTGVRGSFSARSQASFLMQSQDNKTMVAHSAI
jgi:poly-D-alanine transfer protein DltD